MSAFLREHSIRLYQMASSRRFMTRLDELNRQQGLNRGELLALQEAKLYRLLENAYTHVPYYRRLFDKVGLQPADVRRDPATFRSLPILSRALVQENFGDLQTTHPTIRRQLTPLTTGGSTGQPLRFMQDNAFRDYVTADVHRHLGWAGWKLGVPHCYIWGTNFEVAAKQTMYARLMDWALNRFVTNAYILSEETMGAFVEEILRRRPEILFGYPSCLYRFAEFIRQKKQGEVAFKSVFSSAEVLYPHQRQFVERTFDCKIFDRYGTRELGGLGCQCQFHTGLHVSVENVYVEILNDKGGPTQPGQPGEVVVTNLNNYGMPFIRYSLGDIASWHPNGACQCGRAHPMLAVVEGRNNDMFKTRDGRSVWGGIANPLWGIEGVKQFQLIQKTFDSVIVRVVKEGNLQPGQRASVERAVRTALGDQVRVEFEFPAAIPMEKSGKYRYQICEIAPSQLVEQTLEEEYRRG